MKFIDINLQKWSPKSNQDFENDPPCSKMAALFSSQVINDQPLTKRGFFLFSKEKKPREEVVLLGDGY